MYIFFCLTCELAFQIFASSRLSCSCRCKLECFVSVYRFLEDVRELKSKVVLRLVTQLCPILCDTMNCSPPGSSVHGIPQAGILELVVIPLSRGSSWPRDQTRVSCIAGRFFTESPGTSRNLRNRISLLAHSPAWPFLPHQCHRA